MKKYCHLWLALALLGSCVGWQTAQAGIQRHCQVIKIGHFRYRYCQANYGPWRPHHRWRRWHRRHHYRRHHRVKRCNVRITPWGKVRRCVVHRW